MSETRYSTRSAAPVKNDPLNGCRQQQAVKGISSRVRLHTLIWSGRLFDSSPHFY